MTQRSRIGVWGLCAAAVLVAANAVVVSTAEGQEGQGVADPPIVLVIRGNGASAGEDLVLAGAGWEPSTPLEAAVCGNQAEIPGLDCVSLGSPFVSEADGSIVFDLALVHPPTECPCVVRVRSLDRTSEAFTSIDIVGMDEIEEPDVGASEDTIPEPEPSPAVDSEPLVGDPLAVEAVSITGGGWQSWFGLASDRSLGIVVSNPGDTDVARPTLRFVWGRGPDPQHLVEVPLIGGISAGQTVTLVADFTVSTPTFGSYEVEGFIGPADNTTRFTSTFTTWPWGLFAIASAFALLLLRRIVGRLRPVRRHDEPRSARHEPERAASTKPVPAKPSPAKPSPAKEVLADVVGEELPARLTARLDRHADAPLDAAQRAAIAQEVGVEVVGAVMTRVELTPAQMTNLADLVVSEIMGALESLPSPDPAVT